MITVIILLFFSTTILLRLPGGFTAVGKPRGPSRASEGPVGVASGLARV